MPEEIDEFLPIKETTPEAKEVFKKVVHLEMENMHRENPSLEDDVINLIRDIIK
jgi:hypothetical protein